MIGWWPGDNEGLDLIGTNAAQLLNGASFAEGKVREAFNFDGTNDAVVIPAHPSYRVNSITLEGWIYPRVHQSFQPLAEFSRPYAYGVILWMNIHKSSISTITPGALFANITDTWGGFHMLSSPAGAIPTNQWTHVALTYDSSSGIGRLFINGEVVDSQNFGPFTPYTSEPLNLGNRQPTYFFDGKLDEFALYNRALASEEVRRIYLAGSQGKCQPEIPPSVAGGPQQLTVPLGSTLRLAPIVQGTRPLSVWWQFNGTNLTEEPALPEWVIPVATLAHTGDYSIVLSNAFGVVTAMVAQVTVQVLPPTITAQPQSRSVVVGGEASFSVTASGTPPLAYQWYYNDAALAGATNATLVLTNVSLAQSGRYQVVVTNEFGAATSAVAMLTVELPQPKLIVKNVSGMAGAVITVPVLLVANGTENAMQFSLSYNVSRLQFVQAQLGADVPTATLFTNGTQVANGRIGLAISLPAEQSIPAGTQEVARLVFQSIASSQTTSTTISFTGWPLAQQVANARAQVLPAQYFSGTVSLVPTEYEADVAPRGDPDRQVTVIDWVQVGRYVAALDTPAPGREFQRADCAPRGEGGNGILSATDWVQAGRFAAGLDPLMVLSGPTNFVDVSDPPPGLVRQALPAKAANGNACTVTVAETTLVLGQEVTVPVVLHGSGGEGALTFSLQFNPASLTFVRAQALAPAGASAILNQNTAQAAQGRVGFALSLQAGQSFSAGQQQVVLVTFRAQPEARGPVALSFASQPVAREVATVDAQPVANTTWTGRVLPLALPAPEVSTSAEAGRLTFRWPAALSGVYLEATDDLASPNWTRVNLTAEAVDGKMQLNIPADAARKFYRLRTE
ncbi:immunoglobulin domain-containing protein [Fontisphaera persica]|nr:LamG-like jellyroll fold domain-containing protein [Fontisphaera persica]WCJ61264.1 immunoglobulin domain-containing protein [Fontisphaera persica]